MTEHSERRWKVYCHTNKINGKKYFGITSTSLNTRFQNGRGYSGCRYFNNAIQKYGWDNFEHEVISDNLTKEEAMSLEELLVFFNMTQDSRYGYNIKDGGDTPAGISEEGRASLIAHNTGANSPRARAVVVFNLLGTKVAEFKTIKDASEFIGAKHLSRANLVKGDIHNGYIIRYKDDVGEVSALPFELFPFAYIPDSIKLNKPIRNFRYKKIVLFDVNTGERAKEFHSLSKAKRLFCPDIERVLKTPPYYYNGFICRYADDVGDAEAIPLSECIIPYHSPSASKAIKQYSLDGELIAEYESATEAQRLTGVSSVAISQCVRKKSQQSGGFIWRFINDTSTIESPKSIWDKRRENGTTCGKAIDKIDKNTGEVIETYPSIREAARAVNGDKANIQHAIKGVNRTRSAYGYKWKFHDDGVGV